MKDRALVVRFALYGMAAATVGDSWSEVFWVGAFLGLAGLVLEKRLQSLFDGQVAFFATLGLLTSMSVTGEAGVPDLSRLVLLVASCLVFFWSAADPTPGTPRLALTAGMAVAPALLELIRASEWRIDPQNLLVALFGPPGLLYGAPLMWAGALGLISLGRDKPGLTRLALAAIIPGTATLLLATDQGEGSPPSVTWLPFLLPGIARCFDRIRAFARRRPERVSALGGALLVLWNLLFMEQYRRRLLPSDDTVEFARVTSNSAAIVSRFAGTPFAWPANWIFAKRFDAPVERWDGIAGRRLFENAGAATATVEFGDDPSLFATDTALLLEGFGTRRTCERGWCRDLDGAGRLLLPLPQVGRGEFLVRLRARGQGALSLSLNGVAMSVSELSESLSEVTLRVPARLVKPGISVLFLSVVGGGKATLDRLTLERDLASGSTR